MSKKNKKTIDDDNDLQKLIQTYINLDNLIQSAEQQKILLSKMIILQSIGDTLKGKNICLN